MGISVSTARCGAVSFMFYFLCVTAATITTGASSTTSRHCLLFCARLQAVAKTTTRRQQHLLSSSRSNNHVDNNNNVISSTQSTTVKKIRALLTSRKKRLEYGATIVEGPRPILDLLSCDTTRSLVQQILIEQGKGDGDSSSSSSLYYWDIYYPAIMERLDNNNNNNNPATAADDAPSRSRPMILPVTSQVMRSLSDTVSPQGIVAVVTIPQFDLVRQQQQQQQQVQQRQRQQQYNNNPLFLVLDAVSDPGNLGTLLRSCVAVGASGVILLPGTTDPWNPKALRSSMGCAFNVPMIHATSWQHALKMLHDMNCYKICAATMLDNNNNNNNDSTSSTSTTAVDSTTIIESSSSLTLSSTSFWDVDWTEQAVALIIGNEGNGLSADIRQAIIHQNGNQQDIQAVHVPMQAHVESLNAGVCGSVILFEYLRQCQFKHQQQPQQQQQQGEV